LPKPTFLRQLALTALFTLLFLTGTVGNIANAEPPKLKFGIMSLAPYGYKKANEEWEGNFFDLANAIIAEMEIEGSVRVLPVARVGHEILKTRTIDCTITAQLPFMENNFQRVARIDHTLKFGVLTLPSTELKTYADLKKLRVAVPLGAKMGLPFDQDETLEKVQVRDYSNAMLMLDRGRVEAAVGVIDSLLFSAKKIGLERTAYGKPLIFKAQPINIYCAPGSVDPVLKNSIQQAIDQLSGKGIVQLIFDRYR